MTRVKAYLIVQAVLCLLLVVLLSVSAVNIYREGSARKAEHPLESIYTTQDVARKAEPILPLFFIAVGMTAAGLLLGVKDEHAEKPVQDARTTRDLTAGRIAVPAAVSSGLRFTEKKPAVRTVHLHLRAVQSVKPNTQPSLFMTKKWKQAILNLPAEQTMLSVTEV